jgi:hypothetical protein
MRRAGEETAHVLPCTAGQRATNAPHSSAIEAAEVDERILRAWEGHARRFVVEARPSS